MTSHSNIGGSGRPRRDPWVRQIAQFRAPSGRWRYDPLRTPDTSDDGDLAHPKLNESPLRIVEDPDFYVAVMLEGTRDTLTQTERELLGAGRMLADAGKGAVIAICQSGSTDASEAGADRVMNLPAGGEGIFLPARQAALLIQVVCDHPVRHVLLPDTSDGRDICLRAAAALDEFPAIGVHKLSVTDCVRQAFGGTRDIWQALPRFITIGPGVGEPVQGVRFEAREMPVEPPADETGIECLSIANQRADEIPLEEAAFILSAGNGVSDWDSYRTVCRKLNATPAASRVVCDAGFMARDRQVGASGSLTKADCYVALGISGAIQHLQGIEDCARVVAVNTDPFAPIVRRADLSIIGDANRILAEMLTLMEPAP